MKNRIIRALALVMLLALAVGMLPAMAAGKPRIVPTTTYVDPTTAYNLELQNVPEDAKVIYCKSSKPYVVRVWGEGTSLDNCYWQGVRPGKSRITLKYKANGETKTISATFTVKKLPTTLTSLAINGEDCVVKYFPHRYEVYYYTKNKATVTFKASSSWHVDYRVATLHNADWSETREIRWKSGKAFSVPAGWGADLYIGLNDRKGGFFTYTIFINR